MKLSVLHLSQPVVISLGKETGGGEARQDLRESSFSELEGWFLSYDRAASEFSIFRHGMPAYVRVVGVAASYVEVPPPEKKGGK